MSDDPSHPMYRMLYFGREVVERYKGVSIFQVVWKKRTYPDPALKVVIRENLFFALGKRFSSLSNAEHYIDINPPVKGDGKIPLP